MPKNFEDFVATIDENRVTNIINTAHDKAVTATQNIDSQKTGAQVMSVSYFVALELLREYHEWLHQ